MKSIITHCFCLFFLHPLTAQDDPSELKELFDESNSIAYETIVDTLFIKSHSPQFPGGTEVFYHYISDRVKLVRNKDTNIKGRVTLSFLISEDGSINRDSIKVIQTTNPVLNIHAINIIANSPRWIPALASSDERRAPVPVKYRMTCIVPFEKNRN